MPDERPNAWFPLYAATFEADTADLTCEEVGAYLRLLNHHFMRGSVPADCKRIARIIRETPQKTRKLWRVLQHFFYEKDGCFYNKRMSREIAKAIDISEKRKEAGRIGGQANAKAKAKASALAKGKTVTDTVTTKSIKPPSSKPVSRFDDWWDAYGKKVERLKCEAIWKRRKFDEKKTEAGEPFADFLIRDALRRHQNDQQWLRGYQPNPRTYLNGDRWNDDLTKARPNPGEQPVRESRAERSERKERELAEKIAGSFAR